MSLYLLACPLIFFVAFIQYMKSFEHIFIKTYEFFFLVSSKVSCLVEGLLYLPEIFLLEFLQHFYFLGSLFLCFYAKLITVHIISLTWTYIFFSEILKDPDQIRCSDRSWKRRGIPPIAAYSEQWLIFQHTNLTTHGLLHSHFYFQEFIILSVHGMTISQIFFFGYKLMLSLFLQMDISRISLSSL